MAKHLLISGLVQGVGFRESMRHQAERLGLTGWVRNRRDGTVEAVIAGSAQAIDAMLDWVQIGPPAARVEKVGSTEIEASFERFECHPTA